MEFLDFLSAFWYYILAAIWGVIALSNEREREKMMARVEKIITKPLIFEQDENPASPPYYPRKLLESIAEALTSVILQFANSIRQSMNSWKDSQVSMFLEQDQGPWQRFFAFFLTVMLGFFLFSDLVAIFNTMEAYGFVAEIPPSLRRYELAVTFGSFFTVLISLLVLFDLLGKTGLTEFGTFRGWSRVFVIFLTVGLSISGIVVVIGLGLVRFRLINILPPDVDAEIKRFADNIVLIVVPVNTVLATGLIGKEGLKGIQVLLYLAAMVLVAVFYFVLFIMHLLGYIVAFVLDISSRIILVGLFIGTYYLINPIDTIRAWRLFGGTNL